MKYLKLFGVLLLTTTFSLLAGALNWVNQLAIVMLLYFICGLTYKKEEFNVWFFFFIQITPFLLIYGYSTIQERLSYLYPIVIAPPLSLFFSLLIKRNYYFKRKKIFYLYTAIFLSFSSLAAYLLMPNWILYFLIAKDNFHNGNQVTHFEFRDLQGNVIKDNSFKGKIVVLDFWNNSCSICYKEFPEFEKLAKHYSSDTSIAFYSVFIPLSGDTSRYIQFDKSLNYNFGQLTADYSESDSLLNTFKIRFFPSLVILDEDLKLFYSGTFQYKKIEIIDNGYFLIDKIKKNKKNNLQYSKP